MGWARPLSAAVGIVGTVLVVFGFLAEPAQASFSYLFAFVYVLSIVLGALFLLMIGHASNATWFVPLRRWCERIVAALPFLVLGLVPILLFARELYPWTHWQDLAPMEREHVAKKLAWLNLNFFAIRSFVYMAIFVLFGELLRYWSQRQDHARDVEEAKRLHQRMVALSVGGLVLLSLVVTFASWDWVMSLEPAWYSNLYGVYIFAGGLLSALGLVGARTALARRRGVLPEQISSQHYHAVGRLQLAMVIFWAYIGWCHVLQQWIANLPIEAIWYQKRWYHGWQWEGVALIVTHFVIPFFLLLSRAIKKNPVTFIGVSIWLVIVHALDVHYLVLPVLHQQGYGLSWQSFAALAAVSGLTWFVGSLRGRRLQQVPVKDPLLERGLAYESQS